MGSVQKLDRRLSVAHRSRRYLTAHLSQNLRQFIKKEPNAKKYIKRLLGSEEFINSKELWYLRLVGANPAELLKMPHVMERVNAYRAVCGRLKSDYRYSKDIVYNNFPFIVPEMPHGFDFANAKSSETKNGKSLDFPNPCGNLFCTPEQACKIEQTAQAILDARAKYPDSSLADLYDETLMPADLRKAHRENDKAVMAAYGFKASMTESEIVGELFKLYAQVAKATS